MSAVEIMTVEISPGNIADLEEWCNERLTMPGATVQFLQSAAQGTLGKHQLTAVIHYADVPPVTKALNKLIG